MYQHSIFIKGKPLFILIALLMLSFPTRAQTGETEIDNCCFVDRQCTTNYDWVSGYYAFQNSHCAAPPQQRQSTSLPSQPQASSSSQPAASKTINNCCFTGWQCVSEEEWTSGYWAFQNDECSLPAAQPPQQRQHGPNQGTDENIDINASRQPTYLGDGTILVVAGRTRWAAVWRKVCGDFIEMHDHPECQ